MRKILFIYCIILWAFPLWGQIPIIPTPEVHSFGIYGNIQNEKIQSASSPYYKEHSTSSSIYDPNELARRNQAAQREIDEAVALQSEHIRRLNTANYLITNGFPSQEGKPGTDLFRQAYEEIKGMLGDSLPMSIERAVYLVENAYLGNRIDFKEFQKSINERVNYCNWRLKELKLNPKDGLAVNMAIFSLLTDTLNLRQPGTEKRITHYPLKYNLDDYDSSKDFTSHFVITLLATNTGQCHSMPLLYLIMAEKMGADACLSFAPRHSFIKIQDGDGSWYNMELTCRSVLSDYHYMNSSYIKSEAIRNKLYLTPLSKKETMASMLINLSRYYLIKYGYDPFILKCIKQSKKYAPNDIDNKIIEADYETRLTLEIARLLQAPKPEILKEISPEAYRHYQRMRELYKEIDDSGYEDMPTEIYQKWLNYVASKKADEQKSPRRNVRKIIK